MNKIFIKVFLFFLPFSIFSDVNVEFSLNSDSIWRGITQNDNNPTIGTEINFSLENGFFSGAWIDPVGNIFIFQRCP